MLFPEVIFRESTYILTEGIRNDSKSEIIFLHIFNIPITINTLNNCII